MVGVAVRVIMPSRSRERSVWLTTDMPSARFQAIEVGAEQPPAGRVPFWIGLPGLSEHRPEGDDIARTHVVPDRAVGTAAFDDPLQGAVDLAAQREGFRGCDRRPAMQRQDEVVALG